MKCVRNAFPYKSRPIQLQQVKEHLYYLELVAFSWRPSVNKAVPRQKMLIIRKETFQVVWTSSTLTIELAAYRKNILWSTRLRVPFMSDFVDTAVGGDNRHPRKHFHTNFSDLLILLNCGAMEHMLALHSRIVVQRCVQILKSLLED